MTQTLDGKLPSEEGVIVNEFGRLIKFKISYETGIHTGGSKRQNSPWIWIKSETPWAVLSHHWTLREAKEIHSLLDKVLYQIDQRFGKDPNVSDTDEEALGV